MFPSIFPCLSYKYKSGRVTNSPLLLVVKGMFCGRIGFYYLTNFYCSKFPMFELTGFITITYHNSYFWIRSKGKEDRLPASLIRLL